MRERAIIHITGIVQGVGFRPFVYRVATNLSLVGSVLNMGDAGVRIIVEGERRSILNLVKEIRNNLPSISRIDSLDISWMPVRNEFATFSIERSTSARGTDTILIIPPDIAICNHCIEDLTNPTSRWFLYPFTSCAACGPRFSTITNLPYDRPSTTMTEFPLCDTCNIGYTDPLDRRYHAQTTACALCGPLYTLFDAQGNKISKSIDIPIRTAMQLINDGLIIAVQGIGGTHIVTKTSDVEVIKKLRERKKRSQRPFAIMVRNLDALQRFVVLKPIDIELLSSWKRPIVLVTKKTGSEVSMITEEILEEIAPGLDTVGVMLPYAPLHHLLFRYSNESAFIMTSANPTGVPMYIEPNEIVSELKNIADYYLLHNRRIHQRTDDSVVKVLQDSNPVFIRRARGYVPEPIKLEGPWERLTAIAVGPEEKTTGTVLKSQRVYMTQYIGDTDRIGNVQFLTDSLYHLMHLLGLEGIDVVGADLHPEFSTTELAKRLVKEWCVPLIQVQHHYAHLASLIVDSEVDSDSGIVCITADGYGYGSDGKAWGGEILVGGLSSFVRRGGLLARHYPGGNLVAKYAVRPLIGLLGNVVDPSEILEITEGFQIAPSTTVSEKIISLLIEASEKRVNTIESTSAGRFLDAVSLLLGVCSENSYDGECPMKLEAAAKETDLRIDPSFVSSQYGDCLDVEDSVRKILDMKKQGFSMSELAYAAQWHLGDALAQLACRVAEDNEIDLIGFSGGVALNAIITRAMVVRVKSEGLKPLLHRNVPPGDGGISVGQIAVAAEACRE